MFLSQEGSFLITTQTRLGRQLEDHFGSDPEMLWVRIPLKPLKQLGLVAQQVELLSLKQMRVGSIPTGATF